MLATGGEENVTPQGGGRSIETRKPSDEHPRNGQGREQIGTLENRLPARRRNRRSTARSSARSPRKNSLASGKAPRRVNSSPPDDRPFARGIYRFSGARDSSRCSSNSFSSLSKMISSFFTAFSVILFGSICCIYFCFEFPN